jgi:hypothetical protein
MKKKVLTPPHSLKEPFKGIPAIFKQFQGQNINLHTYSYSYFSFLFSF